ncbi:MAG: bifunctional phosphoribosyl-AMP cyclohydrolase/phosphoribosyl-ATP diphosphatase HisIE [Nitrospinae bacterium]|nr:bifunctional phosphoribosyl-AMP cyclohydrolase/phosphoribosyl-ATP diphosphatase HisIE [Nitrospinota bacterium]
MDVELKFDSQGLIPAIVQSVADGRVLMFAFMNADALRLTRETGFAHFWSRSRGKLWKKGETSGNTLAVKRIYHDCDNDALLVFVMPAGPTCHTGNGTCFFPELKAEDGVSPAAPGADAAIISRVYQVIQQRKSQRPEGSYVASLFNKGENAILKKMGEESTEFVMACQKKNASEAANEAADLWFHSLVALASIDVPPDAVFAELAKRFK